MHQPPQWGPPPQQQWGPPPPQWGPPPPPPPKRTGKKVALAIGAVVVLAVVAVFGAGVVRYLNRTSNEKTASAPTFVDDPTTTRPGYGNEGASVADPMALRWQAGKQAVTYGGAPVIQACNLFTLDDVAANGLLMLAFDQPGGIDRQSFVDGGTLEVAAKSSSLPVRSSNTCQHSLRGHDHVQVDVFQPTYLDAATLAEVVKSYTPQASIGDVAIYVKDRSGTSSGKDKVFPDYLLEKGGVLAHFHGIADKAAATLAPKLPDVLAAIAHNLSREVNAPTGPGTFSYDSPVFPKPVADACAISTPADFAAVHGVPASPVVQQQLATAVSAIEFTDSGADAKSYNNVETECVRSTGEKDDAKRKHLTILTTSYLDAEGADLDIRTLQGLLNQGVQTPLGRPLGDEAHMVTGDSTIAGAIVLRKGRFVVRIIPGTTLGPASKTSPDVLEKALLPVAEAVIARLPAQ
jgi:hypothetical protein